MAMRHRTPSHCAGRWRGQDPARGLWPRRKFDPPRCSVVPTRRGLGHGLPRGRLQLTSGNVTLPGCWLSSSTPRCPGKLPSPVCTTGDGSAGAETPAPRMSTRTLPPSGAGDLARRPVSRGVCGCFVSQ